MTRTAISPRFAIRTFLTGARRRLGSVAQPDEGLAGVDRITILDEKPVDEPLVFGSDLAERLHDLDEPDDITGPHPLALGHERILLRRALAVEGARQRRVDGLFVGHAFGDAGIQNPSPGI